MNFAELYNMAEDYYVNKEYSKALKCFELANTIEESNDCINYIGCCHIEMGNLVVAEECLLCLIDKCPNWERPRFNLARAYMKKRKYDKALELLNEAELINPYNADTLFYFGVYYFAIKNYELAQQYYLKSIAIDSDESTDSHLNLGMCYFRQGEFEVALEEFKVAYRLDRSNIDALYDQGLAYMYLQDYSSALTKLIETSAHRPNDVDCMLDICNCYSKLKDYKKLLIWSNRILELEPDNEIALKISSDADLDPASLS